MPLHRPQSAFDTEKVPIPALLLWYDWACVCGAYASLCHILHSLQRCYWPPSVRNASERPCPSVFICFRDMEKLAMMHFDDSDENLVLQRCLWVISVLLAWILVAHFWLTCMHVRVPKHEFRRLLIMFSCIFDQDQRLTYKEVRRMVIVLTIPPSMFFSVACSRPRHNFPTYSRMI